MTVQLTDDVYWIEECYDLGDQHRHVSVYVVEDDQGNVLVDTGSFYHRDGITAGIREATDDAGVDTIILSHSDYPHSANVDEFDVEGGDVELVASSGAPAAQGLPDATKCEIGGEMEILGRSFSFIDPPLADRSHTTWIYDYDARVLFTADGFGNRHRPGECIYTSQDFDDGIDSEEIYEFHRDELVWLRYVNPEKLRTALDSIFEEYPIEYVAPIHGNPIAGEDLDAYLDDLSAAAERISDEYTIPSSD